MSAGFSAADRRVEDGEALDKLPKVPGDESTDYYALYLTPALSEGAVAGISDVWGHYHSRVVDNFELISTWLEAELTTPDSPE